MRSMLESIKELEEKKRTLEQTQDLINEELVKLRAQGNYTARIDWIHEFLFLGRVAGTSSDVQKELSQQMKQISEQHQKQLATLREEIRTKEGQMETLKE